MSGQEATDEFGDAIPEHRLVLTKMDAHKMEEAGNGPVAIVSSLLWCKTQLCIHNERGEIVRGEKYDDCKVIPTLVYADSQTRVENTSRADKHPTPLLINRPYGQLKDGHTHLQVMPTTTSQLESNRHFYIHFQVDKHPRLQVTSKPFKVITKLKRPSKRAPSAAAASSKRQRETEVHTVEATVEAEVEATVEQSEERLLPPATDSVVEVTTEVVPPIESTPIAEQLRMLQAQSNEHHRMFLETQRQMQNILEMMRQQHQQQQRA